MRADFGLATAPLKLPDLLATRGLDAHKVLAVRVSLNPRDANDEFPDTASMVRAKVVETYVRMQDGKRFGAEADVLTFVAEPEGYARLLSLRTFRARRKGIAPGDIVYDYDHAHLLHSFISRVRHPTFYDAFERPELDDVAGNLVLRWPAPMMRNIRKACDLSSRISIAGV